MSQEIWHSGTVDRVEGRKVVVRITSRSACGSCAARQACGLAEATEKLVEVWSDAAADFQAGDAVQVGVKKRVGGKAVALAYVGALVVLLLALVISIEVLGLDEGVAVGVTLAAVALYYALLWLLRKRIDNTIQFSITKN
ncbi:MAG: SoxR reducing system RseC family protein [Alistipes sp.]|nr:SoxR reducing system RseC family protein [Alistipes sp.]